MEYKEALECRKRLDEMGNIMENNMKGYFIHFRLIPSIISEGLEGIIDKSIQADKENRFKTVQDLNEELDSI